jgi:hypothetical protein
MSHIGDHGFTQLFNLGQAVCHAVKGYAKLTYLIIGFDFNPGREIALSNFPGNN